MARARATHFDGSFEMMPSTCLIAAMFSDFEKQKLADFHDDLAADAGGSGKSTCGQRHVMERASLEWTGMKTKSKQQTTTKASNSDNKQSRIYEGRRLSIRKTRFLKLLNQTLKQASVGHRYLHSHSSLVKLVPAAVRKSVILLFSSMPSNQYTDPETPYWRSHHPPSSRWKLAGNNDP